MKKMRAIFCAVLLGVLIPAAVVLRGMLPMDVQPLIEKKYGGWAGTLRLWVCEGWPTGAGSAARWLNRCVGIFEKAHPGVYIQPEYVEESALRDPGGILPPDLVLFPPGAVERPDALLPLDLPGNLRLTSDDRAAPVLLGGYLWVYNPDLLPGIPEDPAAAAIPADEPHRQWSAALAALSLRNPEAPAPEASSGELDLGLPTFAAARDALRAFANGEAPATLATQREVRRLQALDDQGKGVPWRLAGWSGPLFTDQVLYLGIVRREDPDREALCRAFVDHMLSNVCQSLTCLSGAFAVTDAPSGFPAGDPLSTMDAALRASDLAAAPAFDERWKAIVRESAAPADLWPRLKSVAAQKPEH